MQKAGFWLFIEIGIKKFGAVEKCQPRRSCTIEWATFSEVISTIEAKNDSWDHSTLARDRTILQADGVPSDFS
jgi:hypothetical protein